MAVSISGYSVVVRNKTIDERFPGALLAYTSLCPNQTFCTDGKVTRIIFTTLADAEIFLEALAERSLTPAEKGVSAGAAVVSESDGSVYPCHWLEHGTIRGRPAAWLVGAGPGELVMADVERKSTGLKGISEKELRESFDLVGTENNVEAYRDRRTSILSGVFRPSRVPALQDGLPALRILYVLRRIRVNCFARSETEVLRWHCKS